MRVWRAAVHSLGVLALALWVGGFTFYSAIVIPALHDAMGSVETGLVTQRVTRSLNLIGAVAVGVCWFDIGLGEPTGSRRRRRSRAALLALSSLILGFVVVMHGVMDRHLESGGLTGFYPLHRAYLIASTAQWVANVALLLLPRATSPDPTPASA